ncbi:triose-phosphate isomerase [Streptomyces sp. DHE17-7]|uniref:triose-phosphate isomerase n=1 Tax=Streptomyces sp. DHE17-7 TaxID=2759949 RepID=UPI0022EB84A8|nr:triose-phosphate isomerase [Streptomyces sp. DHE17-7]
MILRWRSGDELTSARRATTSPTTSLQGSRGAGQDPPRAGTKTIVIAYEPVWRCGTWYRSGVREDASGGSARRSAASSPACTRRRGAGDKGRISTAAPQSATVLEIMAQADIDGALVGGASLDSDEFVRIVRFRDQ